MQIVCAHACQRQLHFIRISRKLLQRVWAARLSVAMALRTSEPGLFRGSGYTGTQSMYLPKRILDFAINSEGT